MTATFEKLISPLLLADVKACALDRKVLHAHSHDTERFQALFDWDDLARLLSIAGSVAEEFQFYVKGVQVDTAKLGLFDAQGRAKPERLEAFFESGSGVVVNYLHRRVPALWDLAVEIHQFTGAHITIGAIASFGASYTLRKHYDRQDLVLFQVDGSKRWNFYGDPIPGSGMLRSTEKPEQLTESLRMQAGDVLFVPAGLHHQCDPEGRSLHLGILIRWPTGENLMNLLPGACRDDAVIAEQLRCFASDDELADQVEEIKERICAYVRALSRDQVLSSFREEHRLTDSIRIPKNSK